MRPKTPREKKQISHARDGRTVSGEGDKPSREKISLAKGGASPAIRKLARQELPASNPPLHGHDAKPPASSGRARSPEGWKKGPDVPLGEHFERRKIRQPRP
jgi:hypothetical protein